MLTSLGCKAWCLSSVGAIFDSRTGINQPTGQFCFDRCGLKATKPQFWFQGKSIIGMVPFTLCESASNRCSLYKSQASSSVTLCVSERFHLGRFLWNGVCVISFTLIVNLTGETHAFIVTVCYSCLLASVWLYAHLSIFCTVRGEMCRHLRWFWLHLPLFKPPPHTHKNETF